ncbi:hypothetical protein Rhopal_000748-T1 [Rhodotorula paludigena]|uniref:Structural maintenance of chromosomes protein 5 n=1 Tax=Rhodotorula paludigena TaxID=86838 RepID=A0AAV5GCI3_9BASI|nr:hypothetical protein Rhopal_000748-T1 [Rhodotorula paludigena]
MSDSGEDTPMRAVKAERASRARRASASPDEDADDLAPSPKRVRTEAAQRRDKGKQRAQVDDSDEDLEDEGEADGAANGGKDNEEDDGPDERTQLVRHSDGYVTGSIVRIACHSFLTYDSVEFRPGPALNMIIGPNGTGKSTIACAIAIGLGFPAKVLGRSTKLAAYCKNDSNEDTWVELELKGHPGQKNLVVRRHLQRDSEKSTFELDGNEASAKEVGEKMEELQVQVGNLCTFLPQDRVSSFASMAPPELLRETQRAAGNQNLTRWHKLLIAEFKKAKEAETEVERLSGKLKQKQTKQAEAEKEVRAFEQRERLEQDLALVDVLVKFAHYDHVYGEYQHARQDKTLLTNEVSELEEKNRPFRESKAALEAMVKACRAACDGVEKKVQRLLKDADSISEKIEKADSERNRISDQIQDIKKSEADRRKRIEEYAHKIKKLEALVAQEPAEADTTDIDRQIRDKSAERQEVVEQYNQSDQDLKDIENKGAEYKRTERHCEQEIEKLQQVTRQREASMAHFDPHAWTAVQWLRQNTQRFKGKVFEPARLHLGIKREVNGHKLDAKDTNLIDLIEGPIPLGAFNTFLFEYQEDYELFSRLLIDERNRENPGSGLKLNGAELNANATPDDFARNISHEQLTALGFDAWAIDALDGPPAVLAWLCNTHNLHRVPLQIARRPINHQAIEQNRIFARYYTRDGSLSIRFSMYGNRLAQVEQRTLPKAKILGSGVDQNRVDAVTARMNESRAARHALAEDFQRVQSTMRELAEQVKQLEKEREALAAEKKKAHEAHSTWLKGKSRYDALKKSLASEKAKPSADEQRKQLNTKLRALVEKRVRYALELSDLTAKATELQESAIKVHLQALQADSDHRAMDAMVRERNEELEDKKRQLEEVHIRVQALLKEGKKLMQAANEAIETVGDDMRDKINERRALEEPLEKIEEEQAEIQSNLNCMQNVSPLVLEGYNKRKREIAKEKEILDEAVGRLEESQTLIQQTEKKWLPKLERLVSEISEKFTASFDTLGLLGEVRLAKEDDYEKWGIEIMVSFRDRKDDAADVTLHVLSGQRQSGGERALTTVTYLLALAELARAPFALVDEINQGMDQRAERNMHKMLVETTCKADVGQYFLLTPKLLPDLVYHPKMKVLVINVSPWVPGTLSLRGILDRKRKLLQKHRGRAGASGAAGQAVLAN